MVAGQKELTVKRKTKQILLMQIQNSAIGAVLLVAICAGVLVLLVRLGYENPWTGFGSYTNSKGEFVDAKRLWDWLELIIIPAALSLVAFFLNRAVKRTEQKKLEEQIEEDRLKDYFNSITDLVLSSDNEIGKAATRIRSIAIARTISALHSISSPGRTSTIIRFLWQTGLLASNDTTHTAGLLIGAKLQGVNLSGSELTNADLITANLSDCLLIDANLLFANLSLAVLEGADLTNGDLTRAQLGGADLSFARLANVLAYQTSMLGTTFRGATFDEALFLECDFSNAINLDARQLAKARTLWGCKFDSHIIDVLQTYISKDRFEALFRKPDFIDTVHEAQSRGMLPNIRALTNPQGIR